VRDDWFRRTDTVQASPLLPAVSNRKGSSCAHITVVMFPVITSKFDAVSEWVSVELSSPHKLTSISLFAYYLLTIHSTTPLSMSMIVCTSIASRWRSWLRHCAVAGKSRVRFPMVSSEIFTYSFRPRYGPVVDLTSNRNEFQEYFLGGKCGRCVGLTTYHIHVPRVSKSWSLNLLEPLGPVQACNGIASPLLQ
jgi:hypothetical protein